MNAEPSTLSRYTRIAMSKALTLVAALAAQKKREPEPFRQIEEDWLGSEGHRVVEIDELGIEQIKDY